MTNEEFQKLVLEKLATLSSGFFMLEKSFNGLKWGFDNLKWEFNGFKWEFEDFKKETRLNFIELRKEFEGFREEFSDFSEQTRWEFNNVKTYINQAFERISNNLSYQGKVTQIEKILHTRPRLQK